MHSVQRNGTTAEVNEKRKRTFSFDGSYMQKEMSPQDCNRHVNEHEDNGQHNSSAVTLLHLNRAKGSDEVSDYDGTIKEVLPSTKRKECRYPSTNKAGTNTVNVKDGHKQDTESENITEKPNHSYISLIACAVLASPEKRLVLSDIYGFILENFTYFRNKGPGWRNSIRHNLSLNECFIKAGRSPNGKGHYWAIHPNNYEDFLKGDFRRRRAQRRTKRMIGLPDVDEPFHPIWYQPYGSVKHKTRDMPLPSSPYSIHSAFRCNVSQIPSGKTISPETNLTPKGSKRGFDIESLLKDDKHETRTGKNSTLCCPSPHSPCKQEVCCFDRNLYLQIKSNYTTCFDNRIPSPDPITSCFKGSQCWCTPPTARISQFCNGHSGNNTSCKHYYSNKLLNFR